MLSKKRGKRKEFYRKDMWKGGKRGEKKQREWPSSLLKGATRAPRPPASKKTRHRHHFCLVLLYLHVSFGGNIRPIFQSLITMVLILACNSEHVAHAWRKLGEKKSDLGLLSIQSIVFNRSNNTNCSLRAHLFLSYHLMYVPC